MKQVITCRIAGGFEDPNKELAHIRGCCDND